MKIINPNVELWEQKDSIAHVAKCARVCYASDSKGEDSDRKLYEALRKRHHSSVFRHESVYCIIPGDEAKRAGSEFSRFYNVYRKCPYIEFHFDIDCNEEFKAVYVATNRNFLNDTFDMGAWLSKYEVAPEEFKKECPELMRYTFCVTTSIAVSRELNRTSPNNISERSTRYVSMSSEGGKAEPAICRPWWLTQNSTDDGDYYEVANPRYSIEEYCGACEDAFAIYERLLRSGMAPEDARGVLPLQTLTKVVYTYSMKEWRHIIDLRYFGTTGRPHPEAKIVAGMIKDELEKLGYTFSEPKTQK